VELSSLCEAFGTTLVPEPYAASIITAGLILAEEASSELRQRVLPDLISGQSSLGFAHTERGNRFSSSQVATTAQQSGDAWSLHGEKVFVENGHHAQGLLVTARTDQGVGLFYVAGDSEGLTRQPIAMMDGRRGAHIKLESVSVPADSCLGANAQTAIDRALDYGAIATVAEGVGVCQAMLDMTVDYLKTREQFGVKIGSFQALQHRAVEMYVETELLRSMSMKAMGLATVDSDEQRQLAVSQAKVQLCRAGAFVARQAVQLHGGVGVTDEHDIGLFFKRMHALFTVFGDEAYHLERMATLTS
jgi:alkylation response protein AidB-like acyl-CoA dehydrogenase